MEVDVIPSAALPADGLAVVRSRPNLVIWVMIALPATRRDRQHPAGVLVGTGRRGGAAGPLRLGRRRPTRTWRARSAPSNSAPAWPRVRAGWPPGRTARVPPDGAGPPSKLVVRLTHALLPALDRQFDLVLDPASGTYGAALPPLQRGHWLIEIADVDGGWRLRGRFLAPAAHVGLGLP